MKERFNQLMKNAGFNSLRSFSIATEINASNILKNLNGKERPQINRLFIYANALKIPVIDLIGLFYEDELNENYQIALENMDTGELDDLFGKD